MAANRREFLMAVMALWQAAVCRAQEHAHVAPSATPNTDSYVFLVFTPKERATLCQLMSSIVPGDERSSGAVGAKVDQYIDFVLAHGDPALQTSWRTGLASYADALQKENHVDTFLAGQAAHEFSPATDDQRFFVLLKTAVVEGFYTSEEGIEKELGYRGMTFNLNWRGCTEHIRHDAPPDYKPLLRQIAGEEI